MSQFLRVGSILTLGPSHVPSHLSHHAWSAIMSILLVITQYPPITPNDHPPRIPTNLMISFPLHTKSVWLSTCLAASACDLGRLECGPGHVTLIRVVKSRSRHALVPTTAMGKQRQTNTVQRHLLGYRDIWWTEALGLRGHLVDRDTWWTEALGLQGHLVDRDT